MFQNYSQPKSYIIYLLFFLLCIICVDTYAQPCYAIAVDLPVKFIRLGLMSSEH